MNECLIEQSPKTTLRLKGDYGHHNKKKGVPSVVGFPHCAGSGEGLFLSPKPYPHKCAEAGARTRDLPVTDGHHNHEQNFIDGITCSGTLMAAETETIL